MRDRARGTGDGVRDVVQLEVEEDVAAAGGLAGRAHGSVAVAQVGLQPDLHRRHVRAGRTRPGRDRGEVGSVEGDGDRGDERRGAHPSLPASSSSSAGTRPLPVAGPPGSRVRVGGAVGVPDRVLQRGRIRAPPAPTASSRATRTGADGSWKVTVPTLTALRAGEDELQRVEPGADPAHPEDRHVGHRRVHLVDAAHGDRTDRRAGQPAGDARERRSHRVGVDDHAERAC